MPKMNTIAKLSAGLLCLSGLFCLSGARAQTVSLTVTGDPADPSADTVQVDPEMVSVQGDLRTMRVWVSRALPRTSWDGVPYRSYESQVVFNCARQRARYVSIQYFEEPLWAGAPFKTVDYSTGPVRWMRFVDVDPNPSARIVRAACVGWSGTRR